MEYRKAASRIGWGMVAFFLVSQVVQTLLIVVLNMVAPQVVESMAGVLLIGDISIYCVGFPCLVAICRRIPTAEPQNPPPQQTMTAGLLLKTLCMGFAAMYAANFLYGIGMGYFADSSGQLPDESMLIDVILKNNLFERIVLFCMVPPVLEELVFRKYLYAKLGRYGDNAFILMSGLCFGLFHGNFNQFVYAFVLGALLAWLYVTSGNVVWGMVIHMIINLVGSVIAPMALENQTMNMLLGLFVIVMIAAGGILFFRAKRGGEFSPPIEQEQQPQLVRNTLKNSGMPAFIVMFAIFSIVILVNGSV